MRYLRFYNSTKHEYLLVDLKHDALKSPVTIYSGSHCSTYDLATNLGSSSSVSRNKVPASGVDFSTTSKTGVRRAGD